MLSRALHRSSRTAQLPRASLPRILPKAIPRQATLFISRRFVSNWQRPPLPPRRQGKIIHTRWDDEVAKNAKPLFTSEQFHGTIRSRNTLWIGVAVVGDSLIFYVTHLEDVPISGRRRFNCYSDASVEEQGVMMYNQIMQEASKTGTLLPAWDKRTKRVRRVMERLIAASGMEHVNWEVNVIDSEEANAFVIPGGKVFVYTGILPIAKTDDGLAAILGHEIAHNLARHQAESMSRMIPLQVLKSVLMFLLIASDSTGITMGLGQTLGPLLINMALNLGLMLPASRKQETEADYIGLMMMAESCYDPAAAVAVWQRMEAAEKDKTEYNPQWTSTHPSNANRISKMQEWLPKAEDKRGESDCSAVRQHSMGFQDTLMMMNGGWRDGFSQNPN